MTKLKIKALVAAYGIIASASVIAIAQPANAQITVWGEARAHPRIVQAIHQAEGPYRLLSAAPDDFGGNKAKAMGDLSKAIHSMRKALFFRLRMDDAAIDAAHF
jgi:hypothetical protein